MAKNTTLGDICQPPLSPEANVLLLGSAPEEIIAYWPRAKRALPAQVSGRLFDLAILTNPLPLTSKATTPHPVVTARDHWAKQVLVLISAPANNHTLALEFLALGFSHRPLPESLNNHYRAYGFSIQHYKPTPDWLNSKYWANPERWK